MTTTILNETCSKCYKVNCSKCPIFIKECDDKNSGKDTVVPFVKPVVTTPPPQPPLEPHNQVLLDILIDLLNIQSYSGQEEPVRDFLIPILLTHGFKVEVDTTGNIYATRGEAETYPLLNAHMDSVKGWSTTTHFRSGHWDSTLQKYVYDEDVKKKKKKKNKKKNRPYNANQYIWVKSKNDGYYPVPKEVYKYDRHYMASINPVQNSCKTCRDVFDCFGEFIVTSVDDLDNYEIPSITCHTYAMWPCMMVQPDTKEIIESAFEDTEIEEVEVEEKEDIHKPVAKYSEYTKVISGDGSRPIGGDDKCGIAIAMAVAMETDVPLKLLFTVSEEVGCVGVDAFCKNKETLDWLKNVKYDITIDRRDGDHLLPVCAGTTVCTAIFAAKMTHTALLANIMPKLQAGSVSDTITLSAHINDCVNISAGYHSPHSSNETVEFKEVMRIRDWVRNTVTKY